MTTPEHRDRAIIDLARSIVDAARRGWPEDFVREPNGKGHPRELYTETHFAWAAVLLALDASDQDDLLDLAAARLTRWDGAGGPMTFFNSMAVFLTRLEYERAGLRHDGLESILGRLTDRTSLHEPVAWAQWCGNNAYLQQVAVDTVLLPLVRGEKPGEHQIEQLAAAFDRFRTPEGFFHDLPREGTHRQRLHPPAYIMKMLFLLGMTHELTGADRLGALFDAGMAAALPLLTLDGQFSYFGRTDNSPFASGLTIFNLRRSSARGLRADGPDPLEACRAAERFYLSFPRTEAGLLRCNRFPGGTSPEEAWRSQDEYAYDGQYSIASAAYALLGIRWFPQPDQATPAHSERGPDAGVRAHSSDLGVARIAESGTELIVRTGSQLTAWDRRYAGPTVLRYAVGGHTVVGAVSKTVSSDADMQPRPSSRVRRLAGIFGRRFRHGFDELDVVTAGFVPVLRAGTRDFVFDTLLDQEVQERTIRSRHQAVVLRARGLGPVLRELVTTVRNRLNRWFGPLRYVDPPIRRASGPILHRTVQLTDTGFSIRDRIEGADEGMTLIVATRSFETATVTPHGLEAAGRSSGWGSDGIQQIELFRTGGRAELTYGIDIAAEITASGR